MAINKWEKYKMTTPTQSTAQSGQDAYQTAKEDTSEGLLTPLRGVVDFASGAVNKVGGAVDQFAGTHFKDATEQARQQAQNAISQGNAGINTTTNDILQKHQQNLGYTSGITNHLGYITEDLPAAAANVVQGVGKIASGASQFVSGGIDTLKNTFSPEGNNKYFMRAEQGGMDAISGALQLLAAPAPLLPDVIEKPLTDIMSVPTHVADFASNATASLLKVDPESPQGALLKQGFENVAGLLLTKAAPKIQQKVFGGKKGTTPTIEETPLSKEGFKPEVLQAGKDLGINSPAPVYNQSPALRLLYTLGAKGFFGNSLSEKVNTFTADLQNAVVKLKEKTSPVAGKLEAGNMMMNGFRDYIANINKMKNAAYDQISTATKGFIADITNTSLMARQIKENMAKSMLPNEITKYLDPILNRILEKDESAAQNVTTGGRTVLPSRMIDFETLKQTKTQLGEIIDTAFSDPIVGRNKSALKKLYGAMVEDLDNTASAVSPEMGKVLKQANALHGEYMNAMKSYFGEKISTVDDITKLTNPENLLGAFIKKDSFSHLPELTKMLGEEGTAALKGGFLLDAIEKSTTNGEFSPAKFSNHIQSYKDTVHTLFTDSEFQKILQIKLLADASKPLTKVMEGSQTTPLQRVVTTFGSGGLGGAAFSIFNGQYGTALGLMGLVLAPDVLSAFLFKTKVGESILQNKVPGVKAVKAAVEKASTMTKNVQKEIRPIIKEVQKSGIRQQPQEKKKRIN